MATIAYLIAGFAVILGTVAVYFFQGGIQPSTPDEWAGFGTYVGGIAGPLLSFVALIAVARTMHLQRATFELEQSRMLADQHIRWLEELYRDIKEAMEGSISGNTTLGEVLESEVATATLDQKRLTARMDNLMQLVAHYCRAVDMCRDNISEFYDLQIYADRGGRLLDAIKPFSRYIANMGQPTIEFCDMHLRGDNKRATPEAMSRSSRRR